MELVTHDVGGAKFVHVVDLMVWLVQRGGRRCRSVARSLLCWVGHVGDRQELWETMSTDALVNAPIPMAAKRARRLDPLLVDALAKCANVGELARSGSQAVAITVRWRKFLKPSMSTAVGNLFPGRRARVYFDKGREAFHSSRVRTVAIAVDVAIMGGRDTLYSVLYSPQQQYALWCPPQVVSGMRKSMVSCVAFSCRTFLHGAFCFRPFLFVSVRFCTFPFVFARFRSFRALHGAKSFCRFCRFGQVVPDLQLRLWAGGEQVTAEDEENWHQQQAKIFLRTDAQVKGKKALSKGKAKGKARPRRVKGSPTVVKKRKSAWANLRAIDHALKVARGSGLESFTVDAAPAGTLLQDKPWLILFFDEASPNLAMGLWLVYKGKLRVVIARHFFH